MKKIFLPILVLLSFTAFSQKKHYGIYEYDSLYAALFQTHDSINYKPVVVGSDGKIRKGYWFGGTGSTPGIDAVLAVGQNMTASRSINTTGSYKLTIGNATPGASSGFQVDLTSNSTDATGDLYYRTSNGPMGRIPTGTSKQALHPDGSGGYVWKDTTAVPTVTASPIQMLSVQYTDASNVSTGETDLLSYTLPANTLASDGDRIVIEAIFTTVSNGDSKSLKFYFGGSTQDYTSSTIASGATLKSRITIIRTGSNTQRIVREFDTGFTTIPGYTTAGVTDTSPIIIGYKSTCAASNDLTQRTMTVTYYHYAP